MLNVKKSAVLFAQTERGSPCALRLKFWRQAKTKTLLGAVAQPSNRRALAGTVQPTRTTTDQDRDQRYVYDDPYGHPRKSIKLNRIWHTIR